MNFIDEVHRDREDLARVLKKHKGIRRTVEELYPDSAHFIYELLQNAEDAGATEASFTLNDHLLRFEHNGRPFTREDIWAITDIGEGTKANDEEKIGCFGVGFKAVFAYTETPHIWSPTFSFKLSDLVLPTTISLYSGLVEKTRFEFPFNNPKKPTKIAYEEVKERLGELLDITLLFLTNLETIRWQIGTDVHGEIVRLQHSINHIEVRKDLGKNTAASSHFLRFSELVPRKPKLHVSVAFALDFLPNVTKFDQQELLSTQLKIKPANPGRVAVFFPAEKETSGLRFHLHAPFVPELSRASVKETDANNPLFEQLAKLTSSSLHLIRDLGLLNGEFLGVLPNSNDSIPARYQVIRRAIIDAMNNESLTPTYSHSHAPAKNLLQARASLKSLLSKEDIVFLMESTERSLQWAIGATQKNSDQDRFLSGLAIAKWDIEDLVDLLEEKAKDAPWQQLDKRFMRWIANKPIEWHRQMYALLYKELSSSSSSDDLCQLKSLHLVRLSDGNYSIGSKCYFPTDGVVHDALFPTVDCDIYLSGTSKIQQEYVRKFLYAVGVREVGEVDQVQRILQQRYTAKAFKPDIKDIGRFVSLIEGSPAQARIFSDFLIFKRTDDMWGSPRHVFLDSPYRETGLSAYYNALGEDANKKKLSDLYQQQAIITKERLRKFAEAVGVQAKLEIKNQCATKHLLWKELAIDYRWPRVKFTSTGINDDWFIPDLERLLKVPSEALSRLLWKTLCEAQPLILKARFRPNQQYPTREATSSLVIWLQKSSWIPQQNGEFVRPSHASRDLLPKGFPFDEGYEWLHTVGFGEEEHKKSEEYRRKRSAAAELGIASEEVLKEFQWIAGLDPEERQHLKEIFERERQTELPENISSNPVQRAARVGAQAIDAPERRTEIRSRAVPLNQGAIKQEARSYLRNQYTNSDGETICQACKTPLPFKLDDGSYYFETVEFLAIKNGLDGLKKHYYQNYLGLCPNHSAMFQHANDAPELMKEMFIELEGNKLEVLLAQKTATIYFTQTHIADLKKVIQIDNSTEDMENGEEEDESFPLMGIV
ncbi:hypothetical protein SAMN05216315_11812 [Nitrosospira sp. Nsp18]|uniref:sacsin N-terminal ATP-binding-like domain-containing protein n=1 Tax=Nitrosospira sp. Nsp18 TaxID=1855334 RepID=UPI00088943F9|nr:hypothetical protein [Nitrosospira sp. Nsp18]SDA22298.1 hypothetical protein SAMN05216315_11812 [Nitrosospira sp. Nsp18]